MNPKEPSAFPDTGELMVPTGDELDGFSRPAIKHCT
jgi:hypothetical protein